MVILFAGEEASGTKIGKQRISVLLAASAVGEKFPPLLIGKSKQPRAFTQHGIAQGQTEKHGFFYYSNSTAWMTTEIFEDWLNKFNAAMGEQNRNVALILVR